MQNNQDEKNTMNWEKLKTEMQARSYKQATTKEYIWYNQNFLFFIKKKPTEVTTQDTKKYLSYLFSKNKSKNTINFTISALRFYYCEVLKRKFTFTRPKREQKIPDVLTVQEVKDMIELTKNPKHKLLIQLMYGCGLRVSEAVRLKPQDVRESEGVIMIKNGKFGKDRTVMLPSSLIKQVKKISNDEWVFPSNQNRQKHISKRTAEVVVKRAAKIAKIQKRVSCHTLRHSFATHLLESGTDIRYIQALLGHNSLRTTQIYTRVCPAHLRKVKSPIDEITQSAD